MTHHETFHNTPDGEKLYLQGWEPEFDPRATVFLVHGLGEHSGRYTHVAEHFVSHGIAVYTFDGRGHGKSSEPRPTAYFESFSHYLEDLDDLFKKMQGYVGDIPCFMLGHSMGGAMVAHYAIFQQPTVAGILLSGASLLPGEDISPVVIKAAKFLSKITPKFNVSKVNSSAISKDPEVVKAYDSDPLVVHKGIPARTGAELLKMMRQVQDNMEDFALPVLIMHGTVDKITNIDGSKMLYERSFSTDKTLKLYNSLYHEILNEPEQDQVLDDIINWIEARLPK